MPAIFTNAYLIGRSSWRSFANGILLSVSIPIMPIVITAICGISAKPMSALKGALNIHKSADSKMVLITIEKKLVL